MSEGIIMMIALLLKRLGCCGHVTTECANERMLKF